MTDFDRRWQALVAAARKASVHRGALTDVHAARLAAQGFAFARQARAAKVDANSAWRGMALAASLFLACLIGSGGVAMIFYPEVNTHLAMHLSTVPSTSFIPAPPRPPALATLASKWSPTQVFQAVGEWLDPRSSVQENSP